MEKTKLTKEEALAYVRKIEDENKALKNRCYVLTGGTLCVFCGFDCQRKKGVVVSLDDPVVNRRKGGQHETEQ